MLLNLEEQGTETPANIGSGAIVVNRHSQIVATSPRYRAAMGKPLPQMISHIVPDVSLSRDTSHVVTGFVEEALRSRDPRQLSVELTSSVSHEGRSMDITALPLCADDDETLLLLLRLGRCEGAEFEVPARPDSIREVVEAIQALAAKKGFLQGLRNKEGLRLRLGIEEAMQNAIDHGCKDDDSTTIRISVSASGSEVAVSVRDPGRGFPQSAHGGVVETEEALNPRGRGIPFIHFAADNVDFNEAGNEVTMVFRRFPLPAPESVRSTC